MKSKQLLTIEFRYNYINKYDELVYNTRTITIGVYDTFEKAANAGNKMLEGLESRFKLNPNWNTKERFSKNGGSFRSKKDLITNLGYLQTPFAFYAKIEALKYDDVNDVVDEVTAAIKQAE